MGAPPSVRCKDCFTCSTLIARWASKYLRSAMQVCLAVCLLEKISSSLSSAPWSSGFRISNVLIWNDKNHQFVVQSFWLPFIQSLHYTSVNDSDYFRYEVNDAYQINKTPEPILSVKQLQDGTERKGNGEEHCGVAAARCMRAFQQPQRVTDHICQDGVRQHADLESKQYNRTISTLILLKTKCWSENRQLSLNHIRNCLLARLHFFLESGVFGGLLVFIFTLSMASWL